MVGGLSDALGVRRLVRRYAVPEWMIVACAEARQRGDWRAACEAARVTVDFDDAGPVADLLAGFAPDLLRWHLPRSLSGTAGLATGLTYVLAPDGPVTRDSMVLVVRSPDWVTGSQRLTLQAVRAGELGEEPVYALAPYLWDFRRVGELRELLRTAEPLSLNAPDEPPPAERCGTCGRVHADRPDGPPWAWAAAGWVIDESAAGYWALQDLALLRRADPLVAVRELRRVAEQFGRRSCWLRGPEGRQGRYGQRKVLLEAIGDHHRIARDEAAAPEPAAIGPEICLHPALLRPPVDVELLRHDRIGIAELHPLVRAALFPSADPAEARASSDFSAVPAGFWQEERIRVRCGRQWHWISLRDGAAELLHHDEDERRRERTLRVFGGTMRGCFAAEPAWHDGSDAAPRRLRDYRHDLWRRMEHGGSKVVLALLDAGMDPHVRDGQGRTLLHRIHLFEHEELLPRLLAEGLDVNARSRRGWTPMCEALVHSAPSGLLMALNAAGAHPQLSLTDAAHWPDPATLGANDIAAR